MPNVIHLHPTRAAPTSNPAAERLQEIGQLVATLQTAPIQNFDDIAHALWVLDLANKCIQVVVAEFRDHPTNQLVIEQSKAISALIELTRCAVMRWRKLDA